MANSFSASFEEIWAAEQQRQFYKTNVGMKIADMSFNEQLKSGDTLNRPYRSSNNIQLYTRGTAITINDKTDTNEQLSVNLEFADGFYIDEHDRIQDKYDLAASYGKDAAVKLSNQLDASILGEALNSASVVDDGTLGGTTGNGISLTTSNILSVFGAAKKKIQKQNVPFGPGDLFAVISPEMEEVIVSYTGGRDTLGGDSVIENGYVGRFRGFELYSSNQLANTAVLSLVTNPSNGDTVVINGVTFTFVSSIGTTAGNVLIGVDVDTTRASLATLINTPQTTTATGVALSTENSNMFRALVSASNSNSADTLTVTYKGIGALSVSETLTDATDTWTSAKTIQHNFFGVKYCPVVVVQKNPILIPKEVPDKNGKNYLNTTLYGVKTFADNAKMMVDVKVNASSF